MCKFGVRGWVELDTVVCKFGTRKSVGKWYRSLCQSTPPSYMQTIAARPSLHDAPPSRMGASRSERESTRIFRFESREGARCVGKTRAASGRPHAERLTDWSAAAHRHPEPAAVPAVAAVRLLFSVRRGEDEERRCTVKCWFDLISIGGRREEEERGQEEEEEQRVRRRKRSRKRRSRGSARIHCGRSECRPYSTSLLK